MWMCVCVCVCVNQGILRIGKHTAVRAVSLNQESGSMTQGSQALGLQTQKFCALETEGEGEGASERANK